jgi:two-component system, NarL family, sensor histidine kinase DegS
MAPQATSAELAQALAEDAARLGKELEEIDLLIGQARQEAARHEARRSEAEGHLLELQARAPNPEVQETSTALVAATRRAALMESQIDVLEGKQKALGRMRLRLLELADAVAAMVPGAPAPTATAEGNGPEATASLLSARVVLDAQEDLRRDIARAMHDGPAQSLTNITLQAQIVQRLLQSDPTRAETEVAQLINMVQQTLEATKTFIFDVRPMVLDDLGLVPTLRRAARDRGRKAQVAIEFDTIGADRRLPPELESAFFRIVDDALVGFLESSPERVVVRLEWSDREVRAEVRGEPAEAATAVVAEAAPPPPPDLTPRDDLPPALAEMIQEQHAASQSSAAAAAVARAQATVLPPAAWRAIEARAAAAGIRVALDDGGRSVQAICAIPG